MNRKPISPELHGIIDYAFAAVLFFVPAIIGVNKKARKIYKINAANLTMYNALTDQPAGIKPVISFETHGKIDCANVGLLSLETFHRSIRKDKRALAFHLGFVTLATLNILLTDWEAGT